MSPLWIAAIALLVIVLAHLLFAAVLVFSAVLPNPIRQLHLHGPPERWGLEPERVTLPDGCAAWWLPNAEATGTVLVCHGRSRSKNWEVPLIAALSPHANVLALDFPGHGESRRPATTTIGAAEAATVDAALHWLDERPPAPIVVYGVSMGGAAAILALGQRCPDAVVGLVTDGTYDRLDRVFDNVLSYAPFVPRYLRALSERTMERITGWHPGDIRPVDVVANINVPCLFAHGDRDPLIPPEAASALAARAPRATVTLYEGTHDESDNPAMHHLVTTFARTHLAPPADAPTHQRRGPAS